MREKAAGKVERETRTNDGNSNLNDILNRFALSVDDRKGSVEDVFGNGERGEGVSSQIKSLVCSSSFSWLKFETFSASDVQREGEEFSYFAFQNFRFLSYLYDNTQKVRSFFLFSLGNESLCELGIIQVSGDSKM